MEPDRIASAEARQRHEARIRAEAMAERTRAILERLHSIAGFVTAEQAAGILGAASCIEREFTADALPKPRDFDDKA